MIDNRKMPDGENNAKNDESHESNHKKDFIEPSKADSDES